MWPCVNMSSMLLLFYERFAYLQEVRPILHCLNSEFWDFSDKNSLTTFTVPPVQLMVKCPKLLNKVPLEQDKDRLMLSAANHYFHGKKDLFCSSLIKVHILWSLINCVHSHRISVANVISKHVLLLAAGLRQSWETPSLPEVPEQGLILIRLYLFVLVM